MTRTAAVLICAMVAVAGPTLASPTCAQRELVLDTLAQKYGETRRSVGLADTGVVIEMFASADTGTWTMTATTTTGQTCLIASGQNFEPINEGLPAQGEAG